MLGVGWHRVELKLATYVHNPVSLIQGCGWLHESVALWTTFLHSPLSSNSAFLVCSFWYWQAIPSRVQNRANPFVRDMLFVTGATLTNPHVRFWFFFLCDYTYQKRYLHYTEMLFKILVYLWRYLIVVGIITLVTFMLSWFVLHVLDFQTWQVCSRLYFVCVNTSDCSQNHDLWGCNECCLDQKKV